MKGYLIFGFVCFLLVHSCQAEDYRRKLISVEENLRVDEWSLTGEDFPFQTAAPVSIEKKTLHGGKQEGVEVVEVNNGALRFTVIPTRGMGVYEVVLGDIRLGWDSPVKEIVHPSHINLSSRGGLGWLEGFNEWMVRCGLEWVGHPGEDKFINNVGDEATMDLTLHGKVGNIPASEVEVIIDDEPPHTIRVRGRVDERMFYGPQLELMTEISTEPGSSNFKISDVLVNRGADAQEFQILYHTNFGPPLLEEGAQLVAPIKTITPFNDHAAKSIDKASVYGPPTQGFVEQVYCIELLSDREGQATVLLENSKGDQGVSMSYSIEELPYLTQWKNLAAIGAGYVTGIEPGTGFPFNRRVEREKGRVPKLAPGETRRFEIEFSILTSGTMVDEMRNVISSIAENVEPVINRRPAP